MAGGKSLRDHKNIAPSFVHLVTQDRHFKKHFTQADLALIDRTHRACTFEAFARTIVGQQISTKAAESVWKRLFALVQPFKPETILGMDDTSLRGAGLSGQKVAYLRGLSQAVADKSFDPSKLGKMSDDAVIAAITALKGFGRWSAEMVLIFTLARPDVFSGGDLALREGVRLALQLDSRPTEKESIRLAERWAGHRTAASLLLWELCHRESLKNKAKPKVAAKKELAKKPSKRR